MKGMVEKIKIFEITKDTRVEIFFWLVAFLIFTPRILLEVYERKLEKSLIPFDNNEWTVKDKDGNVLYERLALPKDFYWEKDISSLKEWVFEKKVFTQHLHNKGDLVLVLGLIGDADFAFFNECLVGSTSYDTSNGRIISNGWSKLRAYSIPKNCFDSPTSHIRMTVVKEGGPGYGIYSGPMGFGEQSTIKLLINRINFLKFQIIAMFGLGLIIFVGIQYLFVYLQTSSRTDYLIFSLLSVSVGLYLFITSLTPFDISASTILIYKVLFLSAVVATAMLLMFFEHKFSAFPKKILVVYLSVSGILFFYSLFLRDVQKVYNLYQSWHPIFMIAFFVCFVHLVQKKGKSNNRHFKKYVLAFALFLLSCLFDIVVSLIAASNSYLIGYSFTFFVYLVGFILSKEYADSFLRVEDLVLQRTSQLNEALNETISIQHLKESQAKRFAHDLQSPLSALDILKNCVSSRLSEDEKILFVNLSNRLNDLANASLPKLIGNPKEISKLVPVSVWLVLSRLVSEKKYEYRHLPNLKIDLKTSHRIFELNAMCNEVELLRVFSNLINNSIEARFVGRPAQVEVEIELDGSSVLIRVRDNGKGIHQKNLQGIFTEGFSVGKSSGMGIGLFSSQQTLQSWNGNISIETKVGEGTEVTVIIPKSEKPRWLLSEIKLNNKIKKAVVIDDQLYAIEVWRRKFSEVNRPIVMRSLSKPEEWEALQALTAGSDTIFLVDQDLGNPFVNGLELIAKFNLFEKAILVTGNDSDLFLRKRARDLNVPILPKSLIQFVFIKD